VVPILDSIDTVEAVLQILDRPVLHRFRAPVIADGHLPQKDIHN